MSTTPTSFAGRRLSLNLSEKAHSELLALSKETRRSMTEIVRLGIGLVKLAMEAERRGERLIITAPDGHPRKEIVLPG